MSERKVHIVNSDGVRVFNRLIDDGRALLPFASGVGFVSRDYVRQAALEIREGWPGDACDICDGRRGGVPGNENRVGGILMCDYCHADHLAATESP